ncbi:uncharacterized protein TNCV_2885271 [Trichonephila clavipes]|nr:uncharacterized protein TNCV_2885271 [Trichonephila clavipes]
MKKEYRTEFIDLERKVAIVRFLTKKLHTFWVSKTVTVWSALEQQLQTNWLTGIAAVKIGTEANIIQEGCINRVAIKQVTLLSFVKKIRKDKQQNTQEVKEDSWSTGNGLPQHEKVLVDDIQEK